MMQLDDDDLQAILEDHNARMVRFGVLEDPDGHALGYNPVCGDRYDVFVRLSSGTGAIESVYFHGFGCVISRASASIMSESLAGLTPAVAADRIARVIHLLEGRGAGITGLHPDLVALEGVRHYPMRMKCVLLAWNAAREALKSSG